VFQKNLSAALVLVIISGFKPQCDFFRQPVQPFGKKLHLFCLPLFENVFRVFREKEMKRRLAMVALILERTRHFQLAIHVVYFSLSAVAAHYFHLFGLLFI
jgi:hypothetical protein